MNSAFMVKNHGSVIPVSPKSLKLDPTVSTASWKSNVVKRCLPKNDISRKKSFGSRNASYISFISFVCYAGNYKRI